MSRNPPKSSKKSHMASLFLAFPILFFLGSNSGVAQASERVRGPAARVPGLWALAPGHIMPYFHAVFCSPKFIKFGCCLFIVVFFYKYDHSFQCWLVCFCFLELGMNWGRITRTGAHRSGASRPFRRCVGLLPWGLIDSNFTSKNLGAGPGVLDKHL